MRYWIGRDNVAYVESDDDLSDSMNEVFVQRPSPNGACYRFDWGMYNWVVDAEYAKAEVRRIAMEKREAVLTYKDRPYKYTTYASLVILHSAVIEAQKEGATDWPTLDYNQAYHELPPADVIGLHAAVYNYNSACFKNEQTLIKAINEGASPLDIVGTGWPSPIYPHVTDPEVPQA